MRHVLLLTLLFACCSERGTSVPAKSVAPPPSGGSHAPNATTLEEEDLAAHLEELRAQLAAPEFDTRRRAAIKLSRSGDNSGLPMLIEAVSTLTDQRDRNNCAVALRIARDPRCIHVLVEMAEDSSPYIRGIAIHALGEPKAENAYDLIVAHLSDLEHEEGCHPMPPAMAACSALGELGDERAIPHLVKALDHQYTQGQAIRALRKLTGHDFRNSARWREWWTKQISSESFDSDRR